MSIIDKSGCGVNALGAAPYIGSNRHYVVSNLVDLTGGAIVQGDVYQILSIPPNTIVESVHLIIDTPAVGTTLTMNVGDGGSTAGWMGSTDGKATAGTYDHSTVGSDARSVAANNGYFYANTGTVALPTGDTIDIVMTTATSITAGPKLRLFAVCIDLN